MNKNKLAVLGCFILLAAAISGCGHEHTWAEATCTEPRTCTECGETEGEPLGHTLTEATCTEPKTCSVCGESEGEPLGHTWDMANCLHPTTCTVCGFVPDETLGEHACDTWTEEKEPTCSEEGYKTGICKFCSKEFTVILEKTEHSFGEWKTTTEPSCNSEGERIRTCSVCGKEEKETIAKLEHDLGEWETGEEPEYGTDGTQVQKCKACGEVVNTKPFTFAESIKDRYTLIGDTEGFTVTDVSLRYHKDEYGINICCLVEITNTGDHNLRLSQCSFDLNDNDGHLIGSLNEYYASKGPKVIKSGEKGYFAASNYYSRDEDSFNSDNGINIHANIKISRTGDEPVSFEVSDASYRGSEPICLGRVTNTSGKDSESTMILVVYRNEAGRVINVNDGWIDNLKAGETKSFETYGAWYALENTSEIESFEVFSYPEDWIE
jgi:hypothetical protein